jgi:SAM-dependent methyltransferase
LAPLYWLLAHRYRTPGLAFHLRCAWLGLRLLVARQAPLAAGWPYHLMFLPMDSTRYFEFDFAWKALAAMSRGRYLDVSSPRLFPIVLLDHQVRLTADLVNPERDDLRATTALINAAGLARRCQLHGSLIETAPLPPGQFDAITSLSVIEHIPHETPAVHRMWDLLRPGGHLVISVPCAADASEQYIDQDAYGLLATDANGYAFFQRYYDAGLLRERIFSVTGRPLRQAVYGEKSAGTFQAMASVKRASYTTSFPFWREPYMMGRDYAAFPSLAALPGEGVIAMEFVKP